MSGLVLTESREGVLFITLNRPQHGNALTLSMLAELERHLEAAASDPRVSVALLHGVGQNFCCGIDIAEVFGLSTQTAENIGFVPDLRAWREFPKPRVCAAEGSVRGFGLSLFEAGDICFAGDSSAFQHNELSLGLIPSGGSTQLLPRLVGMRLACDMLLSGVTLSAGEAFRYGLVSRVVPEGTALHAAKRLAQSLVRQSQPLMREVKRLIHLSANAALRSGTDEELAAFSRMFALADRVEGTEAALLCRAPEFKHR